MDRGWPHNFERKISIRRNTHRRKAALLKQNNKEEKEILPFVTQYKPLVSIIKEALMKKCNLIQNQPLPCQSFKEPLNPGRRRKIISPAMVQEEGRWNPSVADPNPLQIRGGGLDGGRSAKKFFSALGASFWSKNKGGPPLDPPLPLLRVFDTLQYFEAILPSLKSL